MPRTAKTDPYDRPCAVKGCNNVATRRGICRPHYYEVTTYNQRIRFASEVMGATYAVGQKHDREVRRSARAAGLTLVKREPYAVTDKT